MSALQSEIGCLAATFQNETGLAIRVCHSWAELEEFRACWNSLLQVCSTASIFQTPEWLGPWWQAFGAGKDLLGLIFTDSAKNPVGVALLFIEQKRFLGAPVRVLRMAGAGSGDSDALDFINAPGYEHLCASAFLGWLKDKQQWDICALETLPHTSQVAQHISALVQENGWKLRSEASANFYVDLPSTWSHYLEGLESSFRPLLTRYPKRLYSRYSVRIQRCEHEEELDASLQSLFTLHQMRWTGRGEAGAFSSTERRDFYLRMARAFLRRGWLEFWLLKLENEIVAAQFCFRYRNTVYLLQEGFHPKYTAEKVGYALRAHVLQEMIKAGATRYDFLGGADAYKLKFGAHQGSYLTLRFAGRSLRGRLLLTLYQQKQQIKRWLKRKLPAPVLAALRRENQKPSPTGRQNEASE